MNTYHLVFYLYLAIAFSVRTAHSASSNLAKPDFSIYHTKVAVFEDVITTVQRCTTSMVLEEFTAGSDNYTTSIKLITVEPGGHTEDHSSKARLLINFGEHGRELISSEIAIVLLRMLCDRAARTDMLSKYDIDSDTVDAVLEQVVLKIVPMENEGGRDLVEGGALCERKNGRGVDTNRNWAVHWGHKEKDYDPDEEYGGTKPFSEPEAATLRSIAEQFKPHVWLNVHSGMEAMFLPYDHKDEVPKGPAAEATLALLHELNTKICSGRCAVGPGGKTVGYLAHGTATDYMHDELNVGVVMTWEVYGDQSASFHDCFKMFNPLGAAEYADVVDRWTAAVFGVLVALPGHPALPPLSTNKESATSSTASSTASTSASASTTKNSKVAINGEADKGIDASGSIVGGDAAAAAAALGRKGGIGAAADKEQPEEGDALSFQHEEVVKQLNGEQHMGGAGQVGGLEKEREMQQVQTRRSEPRGRPVGYATLGIACIVLAVFVAQFRGRNPLSRLRLGRRRHQISVL